MFLQPSTAQPDVIVREGSVPEKAGRPTRLYRRGIQAKLGIHKTGIVLYWEGVGTFKIEDGHQVTYQNLGADEGTIRLFLLSEVLGICLYQRGLFLLHASAVQVGNEAMVFMGVPGAGKSTTATAFGKAGYTVLTDDLVGITFIDDEPYVVPAFSQYKVWKTLCRDSTLTYRIWLLLLREPTNFWLRSRWVRFPLNPFLYAR